MMPSTLPASVSVSGPRALYNRVAGMFTSLIGHDVIALAGNSFEASFISAERRADCRAALSQAAAD